MKGELSRIAVHVPAVRARFVILSCHRTLPKLTCRHRRDRFGTRRDVRICAEGTLRDDRIGMRAELKIRPALQACRGEIGALTIYLTASPGIASGRCDRKYGHDSPLFFFLGATVLSAVLLDNDNDVAEAELIVDSVGVALRGPCGIPGVPLRVFPCVIRNDAKTVADS